MSVVARADAVQRRHVVLGFPLAVIYNYAEDQGGNLAALISYYALLSLFPLLLLASTILGAVLSGDPELQQRVIDSALGQFPAVGVDLARPERIGSGTLGLVVGIAGSLYGGLDVGQAFQNATNTAWSVPRNTRPNPFKGRARSLALLLTIGVAVLATTALTAIASGRADRLGGLFPIGLIATTLTLNAAIFIAAFRIATARPLGVRDVLPGAIAAALMWQLLQAFGAAYVTRVSDSGSATNGTFGVVLGLIAFLYLASVLIVLCVEVNVVRIERLYLRALLTPFTDAVQLTPNDEDAYTAQAEAQRAKGFQDVDVTFNQPGPPEPDDPSSPPG